MKGNEVRNWLCQNDFQMFAYLTEGDVAPFRSGKHLCYCTEEDIHQIMTDMPSENTKCDISVEAKALRHAVTEYVAKYANGS